jgi:hypothetical protein
MQIYSVEEAQARFADLVDRAVNGERIGIERDGALFVLFGEAQAAQESPPNPATP